ncbi:hypothetical protein [Pseudobacteroides cellulosolvens]|uniref:Rho termination factor N-terminal domain-containing protein n=1 Tax=Pseudobacteroides cellulosolvens ATCC 35603 = DSM 2933 TaxID=398512 RepID=A0A0L6JGZ7_9FIRM|nr:hypothetical protein [Pseudobacteroides cellulosolvens]KNY24998.1 hypothetical protein Bccel_0255 [Pseudobacteroides cellulosolvens ATCC 35603 = DSM 2933]
MKFYGHGVIWDKQNDEVLCKFVNGEFVTEDIAIIEKLKRLNYSCDEQYNQEINSDNDESCDNNVNKEPDNNENKDINYSELSFQDLKKIAKEKGVKLERSMKQEDILEALTKVGE